MAPNLKDDVNIQNEKAINDSNLKLQEFQNEIAQNDATTDVINDVNTVGFSYIKIDYYGFDDSTICCPEIDELKNTYEDLPIDPSPGNRYRAYTCYDWLPKEQQYKKQESTEYFQSKEYNYIDGGSIRNFAPISATFLENSILKNLIEKDTELAKLSGIINFGEPVLLGLHQIRYKAKGVEPAYSSPLWLHRDDEPLVFVHLFHLSENAIGGNNLIATSPKTITHIIQLKSPLESMLLTKKPYHAVTPLGSGNGEEAFRDILLVTFMNKKN